MAGEGSPPDGTIPLRSAKTKKQRHPELGTSDVPGEGSPPEDKQTPKSHIINMYE